MPKREDLIELTNLFVSIWNQRNFSLISSIFSDDVEYVFDSITVKGKASLQNQYSEWEKSLGDLHFTINHSMVDGNCVAHHWIGKAKFQGPINSFAPTQKNIQYEGLSLIEADDHLKIKRVFIYSNLTDILLQKKYLTKDR